MYRKDRVLEALRSLCLQQVQRGGRVRRRAGFNAEEIAALIDIDRTNASRDLNILAQEGIVERIPGRPVLFTIKLARPDHFSTKMRSGPLQSAQVSALLTPSVDTAISASLETGAIVTSFETLIGCNESLKGIVQQAKAAMLYPPHGLHTLLCGPSGVGKTTFAQLMHAFAIAQGVLQPDAPFIRLNCADYTGSSQLLLTQLFGVAQELYATTETHQGFIEQAHHGILFLDEIHRLPPEGQEMLLYILDHGRFRRLGDVQERNVSFLLLAATSEMSPVGLLPTFRRRLPMVISLPTLKERTIMERYEFIRAFFTAECSAIGVNIHVAPQALRALLMYECTGNIGQLRTDIQLTCARAYLDYHTLKQPELQIRMDTLPEHMYRGLLASTDVQSILAPLQRQLQSAHMFTPTGLSLNATLESNRDFYEILYTELDVLRSSGLPEQEIHTLLQLDIQQYFQHFVDTVSKEQSSAVSHLVDEHILRTAQTIIQIAEEQLQRHFSSRLPLVLSLHLASALQHATSDRQLTFSLRESVQQTYPNEYAVALLATQYVQSALDVVLPLSEAEVLALLFANADTLLHSKQVLVGIVIAAHGRGVAIGLAELINTLMGIHTVVAVELPLHQPAEELITQIEQCVYQADQGSGVLLFVDFTSLLPLEERLTQRTGIRVRTISGVTASLIVDALQRAQRTEQWNLDQIVYDVEHEKPVRVFTQPITTMQPYLSRQEVVPIAAVDARVLLSVCLTGYGSAIKIAELLEERLPHLREQSVEILCMDVSLGEKDASEIQRLAGGRQIVAIVGTINPHVDHYPFISLSDILFRDGITRLHMLLGDTLIDPQLLHQSASMHEAASPSTERARMVQALAETLHQRLFFINPLRILPLLLEMIERIEQETSVLLDVDVLSGLLLHLVCVLEREVPMTSHIHEHVRMRIRRTYQQELTICLQAWHDLGANIGRTLSDEEAYNIVGILRHVDIFAADE